MPDQERTRNVKCPHCGRARPVPVATLEDLGETHVVRGLGSLKSFGAKIKERFADSGLDDDSAWIDLPPCPGCQNTFQYNVRTGERR